MVKLQTQRASLHPHGARRSAPRRFCPAGTGRAARLGEGCPAKDGPGRGTAIIKAPASKAPAAKPSESPAAPVAQDVVGLNVFSADGTRVGEVRSVNTGPSGDIVALHIRTGGFLGFGGRIVAIPQGKFIRSGQSIRLDLDSDEVTGLPEVKD